MRKKYVPSNFLVVYHNKFNLISLKDLDVLENNLLFSIFKQMKYGIEFSFSLSEIKDMIGSSKNLTNAEAIKIIENLKKKFFSLYFDIILPKRDITTHLFSQMIIDYEEPENITFKSLTIKLNTDAIDIFQKLKREFTSFNLDIFKRLRSKYSKSLFRLLSQYSSIGKYKSNYKEFREYLGVPNDYEYKLFTNRVLYPSIKELSSHFKGLSIEITRNREEGKLVHKDIIFTFTPFKNHSNEFIEVLKKDNDRKSLFALKVVSNELMNISQSKIKHNLDYSQEQIAHSVIEALRYKKSGKYTKLNETEGEIKWKTLKKK